MVIETANGLNRTWRTATGRCSTAGSFSSISLRRMWGRIKKPKMA